MAWMCYPAPGTIFWPEMFDSTIAGLDPLASTPYPQLSHKRGPGCFPAMIKDTEETSSLSYLRYPKNDVQSEWGGTVLNGVMVGSQLAADENLI